MYSSASESLSRYRNRRTAPLGMVKVDFWSFHAPPRGVKRTLARAIMSSSCLRRRRTMIPFAWAPHRAQCWTPFPRRESVLPPPRAPPKKISAVGHSRKSVWGPGCGRQMISVFIASTTSSRTCTRAARRGVSSPEMDWSHREVEAVPLARGIEAGRKLELERVPDPEEGRLRLIEVRRRRHHPQARIGGRSYRPAEEGIPHPLQNVLAGCGLELGGHYCGSGK